MRQTVLPRDWKKNISDSSESDTEVREMDGRISKVSNDYWTRVIDLSCDTEADIKVYDVNRDLDESRLKRLIQSLRH